MRPWDELVMEDCECSLNDLYNDPFLFKYVAVEHSAVPILLIVRAGSFDSWRTFVGYFSPFKTLGIACTRCVLLVLVHLVS